MVMNEAAVSAAVGTAAGIITTAFMTKLVEKHTLWRTPALWVQPVLRDHDDVDCGFASLLDPCIQGIAS